MIITYDNIEYYTIRMNISKSNEPYEWVTLQNIDRHYSDDYVLSRLEYFREQFLDRYIRCWHIIGEPIDE